LDVKIEEVIHNLGDIIGKKSLKLPKGKSESVYRRKTDNTMAKRTFTTIVLSVPC
jgi:hypothetical protein